MAPNYAEEAPDHPVYVRAPGVTELQTINKFS